MDDHLQIAHSVSHMAAANSNKGKMHASQYILIYRIFLCIFREAALGACIQCIRL